jgi:hypothetical protein
MDPPEPCKMLAMVDAVEVWRFLEDAVTARVGRGAVAEDLSLFLPKAPCNEAVKTCIRQINQC